MFENMGRKIKSLAKVVCWIGIVISLIIGLVIFNAGYGAVRYIGFAVIIVGCLVFWIGSFFTYGFGELIEKTTEIAENTKSLNSSSVGEDNKDNNKDNKIELLEKLKAQGLIDEDEYLEQKKEL